MIIKGTQRGSPAQLAKHLLKIEDNEHIEIHEIKGFSTENLFKAFQEVEVLSSGTQCKQFLFSVSLNPPQNETAPIEYFEDAIKQIEKKMSLVDQPRAVVFHEKEGRRHAHCVWSRIDVEEMKAVNLPHYKQKLNDISKQLFLKYDWELPKGYINKQYSDPHNFTLQEWQQAKRAREDVKVLRALFKQAWDRSDNKQAFANAIQEYGFTLARGDKRGFVAVDYKGEVYSLSRWTSIKTRTLKARLGNYDELPSVQEAKTDISKNMTTVLKSHIQDIRKDRNKKYQPLKNATRTMLNQHRKERASLKVIHGERKRPEHTQRMEQLPRGLKGFLSFILGGYRKIQTQNKHDATRCNERDRNEKQDMLTKQLQERQRLQDKIQHVRQEHNDTMMQMRKDIGHYMEMKKDNKQEEASFSLQTHGQTNDGPTQQ